MSLWMPVFPLRIQQSLIGPFGRFLVNYIESFPDARCWRYIGEQGRELTSLRHTVSLLTWETLRMKDSVAHTLKRCNLDFSWNISIHTCLSTSPGRPAMKKSYFYVIDYFVIIWSPPFQTENHLWWNFSNPSDPSEERHILRTCGNPFSEQAQGLYELSLFFLCVMKCQRPVSLCICGYMYTHKGPPRC